MSVKDVVLKNMGMSSEEEFEDATKRQYHVKGIPEAADLIQRTYLNIVIFGDYDCDGIISTLIMTYLCVKLKKKVTVKLPKRFSEGYGMSDKAVEAIPAHSLVITVDNGISAHEQIKALKEKNCQIIIIDHHPLNEGAFIPNADIIIDPVVIPGSDFSGYCGAGLCFKLIEFIFSNKDSFFVDQMKSLAAVATIADMMSLTFDNRKIVKEGLKLLLSNTTPGMHCLLKELDLLHPLSVHDIGFKVAPCINAPGRMIDNGAQLAFSYLYTGKTESIQELIRFNDSRKDTQTEILNRFSDFTPDDGVICVYSANCHPGVVGIVAGCLAERYQQPAIVFTNSNDGLLKGSGRTYGDFNLKEFLDQNAELFVRYGGHKEAAAVTIKKENFENLQTKAKEVIIKNTLQQKKYDLEIKIDDIPEVIKELEYFAPYGQGNPAPVFLIKNYMLSPFSNKKNYMILNKDGLKFRNPKLNVIGFGLSEKYFSELNAPIKLNIIGCISKNYYKDNCSVQMVASDINKTEEESPFQSLLLAELKKISDQR